MPSAQSLLVSASFVSLGLVAAGCAAGPQPKQAPTNAGLPVHNTAAVVSTDARVIQEVGDSPRVTDLLASPDRPASDVALDGSRQTADVLSYLDVSQGMRVAEIACGAGYLTELLARSVGPDGVVFADNPPSLVARAGIANAWTDRLLHHVNANVFPLKRPLASPLPDQATDLDMAYLDYFYGDLGRIGVDRTALDASVFHALKHGGRFIVLDRRSPITSPASAVTGRELHTEESRNARLEIERAGFRLVNEGAFLRDSTQPGAWDETPATAPTPLQTQDRWFLTFVKP